MEIDIAQTTLWNRVENALNKIRPFLEAAGGTCEIVPLPWGEGRRPAQGNQHTNH